MDEVLRRNSLQGPTHLKECGHNAMFLVGRPNTFLHQSCVNEICAETIAHSDMFGVACHHHGPVTQTDECFDSLTLSRI